MADTHNIDRGRFELTGDNPPGPLEGRYWLLWSAVLSIAAGLTAAWIGRKRLRFAGATTARAAAAALRATAAAMTRGIPEARAEVLGFSGFSTRRSCSSRWPAGVLFSKPAAFPTTASWGGRGSAG